MKQLGLALILAGVLTPAIATGSEDPNLSLEEWSEDLDVLVEKIETVHPQPFTRISREEFYASVALLRGDLTSLDRGETAVRFMKLVASIRDGHSNLLPADPNGFNIWFPIRFYRFSDGLYITAAHPDYASLAGARVTRLGNHSAEDAHRLTADLEGTDNSLGRLESVFYLSNARALRVLGIIESEDSLPLEIVQPDGSAAKITVQSMETEFHLDWQFWGEMFGPPGSETVTAFDRPAMQLLDPVANTDLPLHLRARRAWWWIFLEETNTVYMQINSVQRTTSHSELTFDELYQEMFSFIDEQGVDRLILDIRYNSGGNGRLVTDFVHELIRREKTVNRSGRLFTLVGRKTFSASIMFMEALQRHTATVFVGEPAGAPFNSYGDHAAFDLPNSGLRVVLSTLYWQLSTSDDHRRLLPVHIPAVFSGKDYFSGRDPAVDYIQARPNYEPLLSLVETQGGQAARHAYDERKSNFEQYPWWQPFEERKMNTVGYRLLRSGRVQDAVVAFELNTERYPEAWNVWDSLGEAYLEAGRKGQALASYSEALRLAPDNGNSAHQIDVVAHLQETAKR